MGISARASNASQQDRKKELKLNTINPYAYTRSGKKKKKRGINDDAQASHASCVMQLPHTVQRLDVPCAYKNVNQAIRSKKKSRIKIEWCRLTRQIEST